MAKTINGAIGFVSGTEKATNYIKQISDGSTIHDIAVQSGIRFFDGKSDNAGTLWDGTQALEVVIPAVTDIVKRPVEFVGTVGSAGTVSYASGFGPDPVAGYLVFITDNCTFDGQVCEAGDMAVYNGTAWKVIQGEGQVELIGTADGNGVISVPLGKTASNVITVEGKTLALAIDYADVRNKLSLVKNADNEISVANGTVAVDPVYVGLSYTAGTAQDITTEVSIDLPTELASNVVAISNKVLASGDFTFTSGSFPTVNKNAEALDLTVSHNMGIAKTDAAGDFVTAVTAIKSVSLNGSGNAGTDFGVVTGLSAKTGTEFVTGVHVYDSTKDSGKTPAFTLWGQATVNNSTFISGLGAAGNSGDLVSSITVGTVSLDSTGSGILTGLGAGTDVVTNVSFGNVAEDTTKQWFFSGLSAGGNDVVTDVTIGAVSIVSDSNSTFAGSAITSASVSNHVLSFTTGSFMSPVKLSKASDTITKAGFTKTGAKIENTSVSKGGFTSASLVQAATSVSYKSLLSGNVTLNHTSASYFFDKAEDHNYEVEMDYIYLSTSAADVTKNGASITNPTITAKIPANTVAVSLTSGTLPSLTIGAPSATISGTVGTALTKSSVSWLAVNPTYKEITPAGTYALTSSSASGAGKVEVAKASTYNVDNATVTIASGTYVTNILVDGE